MPVIGLAHDTSSDVYFAQKEKNAPIEDKLAELQETHEKLKESIARLEEKIENLDSSHVNMLLGLHEETK